MGERTVHVLKTIDAGKEPRWLQLHVVRDEYQCTIEFVPALMGGWKFKRREVQSAESWPGMSADQIRSFRSSDRTVDANQEEREWALRWETKKI